MIKYYMIDKQEMDEKAMVAVAESKGFVGACVDNSVEAFCFLHRNCQSEMELKFLGYRKDASAAPVVEAPKPAAPSKPAKKVKVSNKDIASVMTKCWTMTSADKKYLIMSQDEGKLKKLRKCDKRFAHQHLSEIVCSSDSKFDQIIKAKKD